MLTNFQRKLFSSRRLLFDYYLQGNLPELKDIFFETYIGVRAERTSLPDYALKNAQKAAFGDPSFDNKITFEDVFEKSIEGLGNMHLELLGGAPYVQQGQLESWNKLLTVISPVPLIATLLAQDGKLHKLLNDKQTTQRVFDIFFRSTLPSPKDVQLEKIMQREGGCDLHIHINGTSEAAFFWQHALNSPKEYGLAVQKSLSDETLKEFYAEHSFPNNIKIERLLRLASCIRERLSKSLISRSCGHSYGLCQMSPFLSEEDYQEMLVDEDITCGGRKEHPIASIVPAYAVQSDVALEALMLVTAFKGLAGPCSKIISYMLHCYLLIQSVVTRLVIQQASQNGFDQFQKITNNQLRDVYEDKQTYERFKQLFGMYGEGVSYIEGRFSPKKEVQKNVNLLTKIRAGYDMACRERKDVNKCLRCSIHKELPPAKSGHPELKLVAHFIKRADGKSDESCWHYGLRINNANLAKTLLNTFDQKESLCRNITGIDAAANELHTPPEVYAPIYNFFRAYGFSNFTYHVGEDFRHLLSGLRAVDEAVEFLSLSSGDRIGHGTALGIDPDIWKRGIGATVWMPQGEWLDNLVWLYHVCKLASPLQSHVGVLGARIEELYYSIYGSTEPLVLSAYEKAWQNRGLDPFGGILEGDDRALLLESERASMEKLTAENELAFKLLKKYHSSDWREKYKKKIPVSIDERSFSCSELLRSVQDYLVEKVNNKNCLVEVMPTSNLRISFYERYEEHHLFTWLDEANKRPSPTICIATDDPGIFSTNLRNELGIIIEVLRRKYCNGESDKPYKIVEKLLQNASSFCFNKSPLNTFFEY